MKNYKVYVHYEGCIAYEIKAESEDAAIAQAEDLFGSEPDTALADNFCDAQFDVSEIEKEE